MCPALDDVIAFLESATIVGSAQPETFEEISKRGFGFSLELNEVVVQANVQSDQALVPICGGGNTKTESVTASINNDNFSTGELYAMYDDMAINLLGDAEGCQDNSDDMDNLGTDLHSGVDWDLAPPANTLLFAPGWGSFGLSPILPL